MKFIALTAALALTACSASSSDDVSTSGADFTAGDTSVTVISQSKLTFDLDTDATDQICRKLGEQNWVIEFQFLDHTFDAYAAGDLWACEGDLMSERAKGVQSGTYTETRTMQGTQRVVAIGSYNFTSFDTN